MKLSSRPVSSSPGRPENLVPPLTRALLNSNGRNRSRRLRASPMFRRKTVEPVEPSSPKVTCMGQIKSRRGGGGGDASRRCRFCLPKSLSFSSPKTPNWKKLFAFCAQKKPPDQEKALAEDPSPRAAGGVVVPEPSRDFAAVSPPKNALLLMRCRSEPRRSSVPAGTRFWTSPAAEGEVERKVHGLWSSSEGLGGRLEKMSRSELVVLTRCRSEPGRRRMSAARQWSGCQLGGRAAGRAAVF